MCDKIDEIFGFRNYKVKLFPFEMNFEHKDTYVFAFHDNLTMLEMFLRFQGVEAK